MDNKLFFSNYCKLNSIPIPELYGYNFRNSFYFDDKNYQIEGLKGLINYFSDIFNQLHISNIFLKPQEKKGGKGIISLSKTNFKEILKDWSNTIINGAYIFEEKIVQHQKIDQIYPKSINTLRINTFIDNSNTAHFLTTQMRFGLGGNYVDNGSSGGLCIMTDIEKGTLHKYGRQKFKFGGIKTTKHPDTNFIFDNFEVPYFKEAHNLVKQLTQLIPNKLSGWDIAITPNGPLVIEANTNQNITIAELDYGGYLNHPLYKQMLKES